MSTLSNNESQFFFSRLFFSGFLSPILMEPVSTLPALETTKLYKHSFRVSTFVAIYDLIDLFVEISDDSKNFTFVPEYSIMSPVAADPLLLSISASFGVPGNKEIRVKACLFGNISFVPPVAAYSLVVKPFFRIKLTRQSTDSVYRIGGPRVISLTLKDAQESDMVTCTVMMPQGTAEKTFSCFLQEIQ